MFYRNQSEGQKNQYDEYLRLVGSLSNLFSESKNPYLYYRVAEKIFCEAFLAEDLSRGDVSFDAKKNDIGIGLKTFLKGNNQTFQKIAEFNRDRDIFNSLAPREKIIEISKLRNARIQFTQDLHSIKNSLYHCVLRDEGNFYLHEEKLELISIDKISNVKLTKSSITFDDGLHEYSFLLSKNTLTKRFITKNILHNVTVDILQNPLKDLGKLLENQNLILSKNKIVATVLLPLYGKNKTVFDKSGLNQWNAAGRPRHHDEVYIPIPSIIHKKFQNFFPDRDQNFKLILPNGATMQAKVCQEGSKALMSSPNRALGKWLLRDLLKLKSGELLTYKKLEELGIDSVRIDKISEDEFEINFAKDGSYEHFFENYLA